MFKKFLKGIIIGIASILPGVSGGTMMVSMGIYNKLIHCITHLFSELKENVKFLFPIFIGVVTALIGLSFLIEPAFDYFPLQTNCLFIGLILGGLPVIFEKLKDEDGKIKFKFSYMIPFLIFFGLVVVMAVVGETEGMTADLSLSLSSIIKLFLIGIVASASMVIPGVSGSMLLLLLGYYDPIVETVNNCIKSLIAFDINGVFQSCGVLVPMGMGLVAGVFGIAKLIEIILEKFTKHAYWAITGLIVASPIGILLVGEIETITVMSVLVSIVTFAIGFVSAMKLGD